MPEGFDELVKQQKENVFKTTGFEEIKQEKVGEDLLQGKVSYDTSFIHEQAEEQKNFYSDYSKKWSKQYSGYKVNKSQYRDPEDEQISETNLGFTERYERRQLAKSKVSSWNEKLSELNYMAKPEYKDVNGKKVLQKAPPLYGLSITKKLDTYAYDLMKSTVRLGEIEFTKESIVLDVINRKCKGEMPPLFKQYLPEILALAPVIKAQPQDDINDNLELDEGSIDEFYAFIERAVEDTAATLGAAVTDALNSFNDISMNMLDKHAIPQKLDEIKQLKDKYKAVTNLFTQAQTAQAESESKAEYLETLKKRQEEHKDDGEYQKAIKAAIEEAEQQKAIDDPVLAKLTEARKDNMLAKKDNIHVAEIMYRSMDADMRYSLLHYGITFNDDGQLVDSGENATSYYSENVNAAKGELTKKLFNQIKSQVTSQGRHVNEMYWENEVGKFLTKDKAQKKDENEVKNEEKVKYEDTFDISKSIEKLKSTLKKRVEGPNNNEAFDMLCEHGNKLALAIYNINKEIQSANDVDMNDAELKARPELARRITKFVEKKKQQLLNLLDRTAGIMNALKYLGGAAELRENGKYILDGIQKQREVQEGRMIDGFEVIEKRDLEMRSFGAMRNLHELSKDPRSFEMIKRELIKKHSSTVSKQDLDDFFAIKELPEYLDLMGFYKMDITSLGFNELKKSVNKLASDDELRKIIFKDNQTRLRRNIDDIYDLLLGSKKDTLNQKQKTDLMKEFKRLQERQYAFNRLKKQKIAGQKYSDLLEKDKNADKYYDQKFKVISDKIEVFRYEALEFYARHDNLTKDLVSEAEWKEITKERSKAKQKDGKYTDGNSPEVLTRNYCTRKLRAARLVFVAHTSEYIDMIRHDDAIKRIHSDSKKRLGKRLAQLKKDQKKKIQENEQEDKKEELIKDILDQEDIIEDEKDLDEKDKEIKKDEKKKDEEKKDEEKKDEEIKNEEEQKKEEERKKEEQKKKDRKERRFMAKMKYHMDKTQKLLNEINKEEEEEEYDEINKILLGEKGWEEEKAARKAAKEQEEKERKETEEETKALLQEKIDTYGEEEVVSYETVYTEMPEKLQGDDFSVKTKENLKTLILSGSMKDAEEISKNIKKGYEGAKGEEPGLEFIMTRAGEIFTSKETQEKLLDRLYTDKHVRNVVKIEDVDLRMDQEDPDLLWIVNKIAEAKDANDFCKLKDSWEHRKEVLDEVYFYDVNDCLFAKVDLLLEAFAQAYQENYDLRMKEEEEKEKREQEEKVKREQEEKKRQEEEAKRQQEEEKLKKEEEERLKKEEEERLKREEEEERRKKEEEEKKFFDDLKKENDRQRKELDAIRKEHNPDKNETEYTDEELDEFEDFLLNKKYKDDLKKKNDKGEKEEDKKEEEARLKKEEEERLKKEEEERLKKEEEERLKKEEERQKELERQREEEKKREDEKKRQEDEKENENLARKLLRDEGVNKYGEESVVRYEKEFDSVPEFKSGDGYIDKSAETFKKLILSKNLAEARTIGTNVQKSFSKVKGKEPGLKTLMNYTCSIFADDESNYTIFDRTIPKNMQEGLDKENYDLSINEDNPDYIWIMNEIAGATSVNDFKSLRSEWTKRNEYFKTLGRTVNETVFNKVDSILHSFIRAISRLQNEQEQKLLMSQVIKYAPKKKAKNLDLKKNDTKGIYDFDQHQIYNRSCWAASHTYVMNTYMKIHGMEQEKFTQHTFKDINNFVPHQAVKKYIDDKSDKNDQNMSFNQEANNIKTYLTQDENGNSYTVADTVITRLPKTAEHHLVFNNFSLNTMKLADQQKVRAKLEDFLLDKIEAELDRTKVPISVLNGGHYLSIVGVDRKTRSFKTMDSLNNGDKLNENRPLRVSDLLDLDKVEFTYPEHLDDKNMTYLSDKYGLKKGLYGKDGEMVMDDELQKHKQEMLQKPQNMLHVHGVEFDAKKFDYDFEDTFFEDQIYMPTNLDLPAKLAKEKKGE